MILKSKILHSSALALTLSGLLFSTVQAETTQESVDRTQTKIAEAAQSAVNTASKIADDAQEAFSLGLKKGKIESLLFFNKHLNGYKIDAQVEGVRAILSGNVAQEIEKDFAEELARSIHGIEGVTNNIIVSSSTRKNALNSSTTKLSSTLKDATITASIKTKLLTNANVSGMKVNVDTHNLQVLLRGEAQSVLEKDLIEQIAGNTQGVEQVVNEIEVGNVP